MNSRVPHSKTLFFAYMADTDRYVLQSTTNPTTGVTTLNWVRIGWLAAEQTKWHTYAVQAAGYATTWANKSNRHGDFLIDVDKLINAVHTYDHDNHLLDRIAAQSPTLALTADFTTFNIKHNVEPHSGMATTRKVPTEITVYFSLTNGAAGQVIIHAKPTQASKKSHLLKGFYLEAFYEILPQKDPAPNASGLTEHEVFTKAHVILPLGAQNGGQKLHIGARWRHKTNPALNGGIGAIQSITIS